MSTVVNTSGQGIAAIVLAAGTSSRMGAENKLLLPYAGKPMVVQVVSSICKAKIAECIVVLGHEAEVVKEALHDLPVTFVLNKHYKAGMGTSVRAGVQEAGPATRGFLVCLSDMPLITTAEYNAIIAQFDDAIRSDTRAIVRPRYAGRSGNPVLLAAHYRAAIQALDGPLGCKPIVQAHSNHVTYVDMTAGHVLQDADTPEAYAGLKSVADSLGKSKN